MTGSRIDAELHIFPRIDPDQLRRHAPSAPPVMIRVLVISVLLAATVAALVYGLPPLLALALRLIERVVLTIRSGRAKCPECYERVSLPRYVCQRCGTAHDDLFPTRGAIFTRRCGVAGCGAMLPTLFWFGKRRLDAQIGRAHV